MALHLRIFVMKGGAHNTKKELYGTGVVMLGS
jgi:hypothetical protein